MTSKYKGVAIYVACFLLVNSALIQDSAQTLLDKISQGHPSASAEQQVESLARADASIMQLLSQKLPPLLCQTKDRSSVAVLAKLAGVFKLTSTVTPLTELLKSDWNKAISTSIYQAEELIDDPVGAALANIGAPSVPQVSDLLQSPDTETRYRAVRVLTKIGTSEAQSALREASRNERDAKLRRFIQFRLREQQTTHLPKPYVQSLSSMAGERHP